MSFDDLDLESLYRRRGKKWSSYPYGVIPAFVADMDFPVAEPIQRIIQDTVTLNDYGYPPEGSTARLAEVFADRVAERFGWKVAVERVDVLGDVIQAIYIALQVYGGSGDRALIQTPIYPPFLTAVAEIDRPPIFCGLVQGETGYEIDFDALRASLVPEARLFMLCNPHNPTGRVFTAAELEQLAEIVLERDLTVIADEIHADVLYDGRRHIPFCTVDPEIEARTITLASATKAFNIAGLRCAVVVFGSEDLQRRFLRVPRHTRGGMSRLGLMTTQVAWEECGDWLDALVRYLHGNRDFVAQVLAERMPAIKHFPPQATFLSWLDCRALGLEEDPYEFFLREARVALASGLAFGPGGEGFARMNIATSRSILTEITERMVNALSGRALG